MLFLALFADLSRLFSLEAVFQRFDSFLLNSKDYSTAKIYVIIF